MGAYGMPCALGSPDLQHHHRLAPGSGAIECGDEAIRISDGLNKAADHLRVRLIDEVIEIIRRRQYGFVAGRHDVTKAKTPDVIQQANAERAALRDDADIAGEPRGVAQFLQIGRTAVMRIEHPHAVRATEGNVTVATDPLDLGLQPPTLGTRSANPPS